jgi:hypothetical protein
MKWRKHGGASNMSWQGNTPFKLNGCSGKRVGAFSAATTIYLQKLTVGIVDVWCVNKIT